MKNLPRECDISINVAPLGVSVKIHLPHETSWKQPKLLFRGSVFGSRHQRCKVTVELLNPDTRTIIESDTQTRNFRTRKGMIKFLLDSAKQMYAGSMGEW